MRIKTLPISYFEINLEDLQAIKTFRLSQFKSDNNFQKSQKIYQYVRRGSED